MHDQYRNNFVQHTLYEVIRNGSEAIFYNTCNIYEKALDTLSQVDSITETDVVKASEVFDVLSLKKIVLLKEQNEKTDSNQKVSSEEHENYVDKKGVAAKRQLEEIRLKMSLEVNIRLRNNFVQHTLYEVIRMRRRAATKSQ